MTEFLKGLLEWKIKVLLSDDRQVVGTLHCVDSYGNLILHDVEITHDGQNVTVLPSAMVPGMHILEIFTPNLIETL